MVGVLNCSIYLDHYHASTALGEDNSTIHVMTVRYKHNMYFAARGLNGDGGKDAAEKYCSSCHDVHIVSTRLS